MEADVGLVTSTVLDCLKELLGPGLSALFVGKGDEELHGLVLGITGVFVKGGDLVVVVVELRDSDGVCFGTDEQFDVAVVQVEDFALSLVATLDVVALVLNDFVGALELRVELVGLALGGIELEQDELAGAVEVLVGLGDVAVALKHELLLVLLGELCDVAEVLI